MVSCLIPERLADSQAQHGPQALAALLSQPPRYRKPSPRNIGANYAALQQR